MFYFRDVLMRAEYPEGSPTSLDLRLSRSREAEVRMAEIRRRDRQQYEEWLERTKPRTGRGDPFAALLRVDPLPERLA